jgi:hypothetical protein
MGLQLIFSRRGEKETPVVRVPVYTVVFSALIFSEIIIYLIDVLMEMLFRES